MKRKIIQALCWAVVALLAAGIATDWFINCEPTHGSTIQPRKKGKNICQIEPNHMPGICNEERSLISPDYARAFICDFILGKEQVNSQLSLF